MSDTPKKKEPTASEAMFFFAIVKHTRNKADIDWSAVATEQGFKNADVAKVRFGQVKRKLGITTNTDTPATSSRTPIKKVGSVAGTPTKVIKSSGRAGTKGRTKGKGKGVKAEDEGAEDDDETVVGVKGEYLELGPEAEIGSLMGDEDYEDPF
ncbi:uncharacterized protein MAM_01047 [Metarhizium album ARSEF 1941]|uniref:Myb-like DNA-binding domain-containing protein n=1 Tax=Metarhizium album (strain ARSEF 1941) TaxID=1081103 RepID=A0A0B2X9P2_METAS|nr:uncharacterized protein MAM_01047 [Metarhizium album ARSEF 1941]KHO02046.1 hypothetical protein MAM_01047 [Metarhizium album ARSEF 1941]